MSRSPLFFALVLCLAPPAPAMAQSTSLPPTGPDAAPLTMPERFVVGRSRVEPKVVLLGSPEQQQPGLDKRLRAELHALGLEVVGVEARARSLNGRLAELGAQAVAHRAVAAVRVERHANQERVTLWLYDAVTGKMLFRQAAVKKGVAATPEANVSLQVVELIHASLLELNLPKQRARLEKRPLPVSVAKVVRPLSRKDLCRRPKRSRPFLLEAGPALASAVDGPGLTLGVSLGGSWQLLRWLAVGVDAFFPLSSAEIEVVGGGSSDAAPLTARAMARIEPWWRERLSVAFVAGLGVIAGYASGESDALYEGQTEWGAVPAVSFSLQLRLRLTRRLRLVASGGADISPYALRVRVAGEQQAQLGPVLLGGGLALAASFGWAD